jgi:hypothetical protein
MITSETTYHHETPIEVQNIIERCIKSGERIRFWIGDTENGEDWGDEFDVTGYVSRSTGPKHIPILLRTKHRSMGGPGILDHCIVRIMVGGIELYRHPKHTVANYNICKASKDAESVGLLVGVERNGEYFASFKTQKQAIRWVEFMIGRRMTK